ncbi:MAG: hypothetical protein QNK05_23505 [Myxococcota bacterium]|nr:hypothetical protein [Myxococcota bacterium]
MSDSAGQAGAGHVEGSATAVGNVVLEGTATSGLGASAGSASIGPLFGESTGGGDVEVRAVLRGDQGRFGIRSPGTEALIEDAVDGRTTGRLVLEQIALGGQSPSSTGPGDAGDARSVLDRVASAEALEVKTTASGGEVQFRDQRQGGDALASSKAWNDAGDTLSQAEATGGLAGFGGIADAEAEAVSAANGREVRAVATAEGGRSFGAPGGAARSDARATALGDSTVQAESVATGGLALERGSAHAVAFGRNQGASPVTVEAKAVGRGALATAHGESISGSVEVVAEATAEDLEGSVRLEDAASGSTAGRLELRQTARGQSRFERGLGKDAESILHATNPGGGELEAVVEAIGTENALASGRAVGESDVELIVLSTAETGRARLSAAEAISTGGGDVSVVAELRQGAAEQGGSSNAILVDVARATTQGSTSLEQKAYAGAGGRAVSRLRGAADAESVEVTTLAVARGDRVAQAESVAENKSGAAAARARATGEESSQEARTGAAESLAMARTYGDGQAVLAESEAVGGAQFSFGGGTGGRASSESIGQALGDSPVEVRDAAYGGPVRLGTPPGLALSRATGRNRGASAVIVESIARGGEGQGSAGGAKGSGHAAGFSERGDVSVRVQQTGGDGGRSGGDGASSKLDNAAEGDTKGSLLLDQFAVGGDADAGRGGDAASLLQKSVGRVEKLEIRSEAVGGDSPTSPGRALASGVATATGDADVSVFVRARGGNVPGRGTEGGFARLGPVRGRSDSGSVRVEGRAESGGPGRGGGSAAELSRGRPQILIDAVQGDTSGDLEIIQAARGADALVAGRAESVLTKSTSSTSLVGRAFASGGSGRAVTTPNGRVAGTGARGEATLDLFNDAGVVIGEASANGGLAAGGRAGDSRAIARGETTGDGHDVMMSAVSSSPGAEFIFEGGTGGQAFSDSVAITRGRSRAEATSRASAGGSDGPRTGSATARAEATTQSDADSVASAVAETGVPVGMGVRDGLGRATARARSAGHATSTSVAASGQSIFVGADRPVGGDLLATAISEGATATATATALSRAASRGLLETEVVVTSSGDAGRAAVSHIGTVPAALPNEALASTVMEVVNAPGRDAVDALAGPSLRAQLAQTRLNSLVSFASENDAGVAGPSSVDASVLFTLDAFETSDPQQIHLGLFELDAGPESFVSIALEVSADGVTLVDAFFDQVGEAVAFFSDRLLSFHIQPTVEIDDIGPGPPFPVVQPIELTVRLVLEQMAGADPTRAQLVLARTVVAEPGVLWLLAMAWWPIARLGRRRRA